MRLSLLAICMVTFLLSSAQLSYKQGDMVTNFSAKNMLHVQSTRGSFNTLRKDVTIIDFFGTWCLPCVRALPRLDSIQKSYSSQVAILLISTEAEMQLSTFFAKRRNLVFPVILDENKTITNLFQPPALPYTVVIDKNNTIVAITEASLLTGEKISGWLAQKRLAPKSVQPEFIAEKNVIQMPAENQSKESPGEISQQFIYAVKTDNKTTDLQHRLKHLDFESLKMALKQDDDKKAFWINIYNGSTQLLLKNRPDQYKNRNQFFKKKQINIAGTKFSLDDIEHDILRRSKVKWSLGYFNKVFPGKKIKALRVEKLDYRIHFALNCGAKSCPPIAFYEHDAIDTQLTIATRAYLTEEARYDVVKNRLELPVIMSWFRHDFKGKKNMLQLAKKLNIVPADKYPGISFKKYDWHLYLNNYKN